MRTMRVDSHVMTNDPSARPASAVPARDWSASRYSIPRTLAAVMITVLYPIRIQLAALAV